MATKKWRVDRAAMFQWTLEELRKKAKQVFETANRRLRNIKHHIQYKGAVSPALERVMDSGGLFSKRGKDKRGLIREMNRAYAFLNSDDGSTVRSAMAYGKELRAATPNLTNEELKIVYQTYRDMEKKYPAFVGGKQSRASYGSDRLIANISRMVLGERSKVYGGLGGDLLSSEKKTIDATLAERKNAIKSMSDKMAKEIESWANAQMNGDGTMNAASRTFSMKVDDVVPDMRNGGTLSMNLTSGTKYNSKGGDGVIKPCKNI